MAKLEDELREIAENEKRLALYPDLLAFVRCLLDENEICSTAMENQARDLVRRAEANNDH